MKFRGLIAAAVILLVLAGVLYWSNHRKTPPDTASMANASPAILKIDPATVTALTVKQKAVPPVVLIRSGAQWQITSPGTFPADTSAVTGMLSSLSPLNSERVVDDHATNLTQYGLGDPSLEVDVTGKNNTTHRLLLGDDTPAGDAVYASLAGDPRVFTAASYIRASLNKSLGDLRDKRLLPIEASSVSSFDLIRQSQDIDFARVQNGWRIEKPQSYRTDTFRVDDLLQQLTTTKWDPSTTAEDAAKNYAKATPVATVKLSWSSGNDTLDVRKDKDDYYAKSSAIPGTWKVDSAAASALGQELDRSLEDFRNKQLFDFGFGDPDKIEYRSGATNLVLTHTNNAWWSNGQKMDSVSVELLLTALREQAASKFVDSGFTNPQMEITVTSDGGKKVERVQIQKNGNTALAKLGDDSSLYSLEAPTIGALTNAIAGVKPATPGKK